MLAVGHIAVHPQFTSTIATPWYLSATMDQGECCRHTLRSYNNIFSIPVVVKNTLAVIV